MKGEKEQSVEAKLALHERWLRSRFKEGERADFRGQNLEGANLCRLDLSGARLQNANLRGANLVDTVFHGANLEGADLTGAIMFDTVFRRVDLRRVKGLDKIIHHGPSTVGLDTLLRSRGEIPAVFLELVGVPRESIQELLAWARINGRRSPRTTVFISYGGPDEAFARALRDGLAGRAIETFFFPDDAMIGERIDDVMWYGVNRFDRVILVCSRNSLSRRGVIAELRETITREAREDGRSILLPVKLDQYVFENWAPREPRLAQTIRDRVVADFSGWEKSPEVVRRGVDRIVRAIQRRRDHT